jgi:phage structural protein
MTKFINSSGPLHLNIYIEQVSQDVTNNSSKVSWRATVDRDGGYRTWNAENGSVLSVWLNGSSVYKSNLSFETEGQETTLASGEATIPHNSDGTKAFSVWASFDPNNGVHGNITVSASYTLSSIPRSSGISDNALSGTRQLGSLHTLTIDRKSNSFTHQVWYRVFGSDWIDLGKNHGTSVSFTPSLDLARHLPKASSGKLDICVRTYNGTVQIGNDVYSKGWYFEIPNSVKPTFTGLSLTDANTIAKKLLSGNDFLQIISDIQVNFNNASGAYGSTITGYRAEIVNKKNTVTEDGGHLGMMNFKGSATIRAYVIDSRGKRSDTKDVTINVIEYYAPSFSFSALRTRGNPNTLQVLRNARIAPIMQSGKQRNVMFLTFKVAQIGNENFTDDNGSASGNFTSIHTLTNSAANMSGNYPSNKSFVIIGKLEDKFTSVEFSATVATESVVMSYDKNGRVGIGKVAEFGKPGSLDVLGDIYSSNQPIQQYQLTRNNGAPLWFDGKPNVTNTNLLDQPGQYYIDPTARGNPNGQWGYLLHYSNYGKNDGGYKESIQLFYGNNGQVYFRHHRWSMTVDDWEDWVEYASKNDIQKYTQATPWQNLTLQNGWVNHPNPNFNNVQFSKSFDGVVYLRGSATKGKTTDETVIGILPSGFRPQKAMYVIGLNNSYSGATLGIYPEGHIVVKSNVDAIWLNFDNISFKI